MDEQGGADSSISSGRLIDARQPAFPVFHPGKPHDGTAPYVDEAWQIC